MTVLRVGSRGSALAQRQAGMVIDALTRVDPSLSCELVIITTLGDESPQDLAALGGEGVFVTAIESALQECSIDLAVHSFKDVPTAQPSSLTTAYLPRGDARDALICRSGRPLIEMAPGAVIGTGSPRRRALLLDARPDLRVEPMRGNVDTRLRKVAEGTVEGAVLAAAGLERLDRSSEIAEMFDPERFVPAVGQGIIAVQAGASDSTMRELLAEIDDADTHTCARAERAVARELSAGCRVALGAHARLTNGSLRVDAFLAGDSALHRTHRVGSPAQAEELGGEVARFLRASLAA